MARIRHTLGPMIAYHGCDRAIAEAILTGRQDLRPSINEYDWLGSGVYFWMDSPERGLDWARSTSRPGVVGALIFPGLCLNLTDLSVMPEVERAYGHLARTLMDAGKPLPRNTAQADGIMLRRALDCAVINMVHDLRNQGGYAAYDTVFGIFEEGSALYPGAGFRHKTHVQIAVRNPECIVGYFRVRGR